MLFSPSLLGHVWWQVFFSDGVLLVGHDNLRNFTLVNLGFSSCLSYAAVLGVVLSLRHRRLRVARGLQAGAEKVSGSSLRSATSDAGDKGEAGGGSDDTMLELLRLKVSGDSPEHQREGELMDA